MSPSGGSLRTRPRLESAESKISLGKFLSRFVFAVAFCLHKSCCVHGLSNSLCSNIT